MTTYQNMTEIELQHSLLMAQHHLKWALSNKAAFEFQAAINTEVPLDLPTMKWYDDNIKATKDQIKNLNDLIAAK